MAVNWRRGTPSNRRVGAAIRASVRRGDRVPRRKSEGARPRGRRQRATTRLDPASRSGARRALCDSRGERDLRLQEAGGRGSIGACRGGRIVGGAAHAGRGRSVSEGRRRRATERRDAKTGGRQRERGSDQAAAARPIRGGSSDRRRDEGQTAGARRSRSARHRRSTDPRSADATGRSARGGVARRNGAARGRTAIHSRRPGEGAGRPGAHRVRAAGTPGSCTRARRQGRRSVGGRPTAARRAPGATGLPLDQGQRRRSRRCRHLLGAADVAQFIGAELRQELSRSRGRGSGDPTHSRWYTSGHGQRRRQGAPVRGGRLGRRSHGSWRPRESRSIVGRRFNRQPAGGWRARRIHPPLGSPAAQGAAGHGRGAHRRDERTGLRFAGAGSSRRGSTAESGSGRRN